MGTTAHRRARVCQPYFWLQLAQILGDLLNHDQQPGVPQQPENNGWQQPGQNQPGQQGQPVPGQPPYPTRPPHADQYNYGQPPYGDRPPGYGQPGQGPYGQPGPGQFGQTPPKGGIPVWGWVAGGVGVAAVLAVTGVMVLGGLGSGKGNEAAPAPTESTRTPESAETGDAAATDRSPAADSGGKEVYLFQDADFTSAPVWSAKMPDSWKVSGIKGGTITYRSSVNACIFTTHQAILPPGEATDDEKATAATMRAEIEGVKTLAGTAVTVVSDDGSSYTKLRNSDGSMIELQEAELRFKNKSGTDLVYRIAVRSMPAGDGLMELNLACPANLPTEPNLWTELKESVTMVDDPAA
jgi:hypothetical protein